MQTKHGQQVNGAHRWQAKSCHQHTIFVGRSSDLISYPIEQLAQFSVGKDSPVDSVTIKDH